MRKRFKYLSHIPLGCDLVFVEIDFEHCSVVSAETLSNFEKELEQRRAQNLLEQEQNNAEDIPENTEFEYAEMDFPSVVEEVGRDEYQLPFDGVSFARAVTELQETPQSGKKKGKKKKILLSNESSMRRR